MDWRAILAARMTKRPKYFQYSKDEICVPTYRGEFAKGVLALLERDQK